MCPKNFILFVSLCFVASVFGHHFTDSERNVYIRVEGIVIDASALDDKYFPLRPDFFNTAIYHGAKILIIKNVNNKLSNVWFQSDKITDFRCNNCGISEISDASLSLMPNLRRVELMNNMIENISEKAFANNKKLEVLILDGNNIKQTSFSWHLPKLLNLSLSQNNITDLILMGGNLLFFKCNDCNIRELSNRTFENVRQLEILELKNNKIERIPLDLFKNNPLLREIDFFGNEIRPPYKNTFSGLVQLTELRINAKMYNNETEIAEFCAEKEDDGGYGDEGMDQPEIVYRNKGSQNNLNMLIVLVLLNLIGGFIVFIF